MKITSFDEFKELARRGTFVPSSARRIVADLLTPVSAFLKIAEHADYAFPAREASKAGSTSAAIRSSARTRS